MAPPGAALAGSFALGLSEDQATSAVAIAANTSSGLNEWPHAGGSDMYFHPGFAASNAILLNKIDLMDRVDFDRDFFYQSVRALNPRASIFELSCGNGEGIDAWIAWLREKQRTVLPLTANNIQNLALKN